MRNPKEPKSVEDTEDDEDEEYDSSQEDDFVGDDLYGNDSDQLPHY